MLSRLQIFSNQTLGTIDGGEDGGFVGNFFNLNLVDYLLAIKFIAFETLYFKVSERFMACLLENILALLLIMYGYKNPSLLSFLIETFCSIDLGDNIIF